MRFTTESPFFSAIIKPVENRSQKEYEVIFENLKMLSTLSTFKESTIRCMTKFVKYETHKKGSYLYRTGDLITCWFIVLNGSLLNGNDTVESFSKFGRKSHYQTHRIVDCRALEDSQILVIDYQDDACPRSLKSFRKALEKYSNYELIDKTLDNDTNYSTEKNQLENFKESVLKIEEEKSCENLENMSKRLKLEIDTTNIKTSMDDEIHNNQNLNSQDSKISTSSPKLNDSIEVIVLSDDSNDQIEKNSGNCSISLKSENSDDNPNDKLRENVDENEIIILSDESNDSFKSLKNSETSIEFQNSFENQNETTNSSVSPQPNDGDDIIELYSIDKIMSVYANEKNLYEDKEVLERWRIKKQSNPNINLSVSNYKLRLNGDMRPPKQRSFKPNIFFDEFINESNLSDEEKKILDEKALNEKLKSLEIREKKMKKSYDLDYNQKIQNIKQVYYQGAYLLQNNNYMDLNDKKQTFSIIESNFKHQMKKLNSKRKEFFEQTEKYAKSEEKALRDLYLSGNYVKGKFSEYLTFKVYQPQATRRNYVDDGCRCMLLPKNRIKNILIENLIYEHYYGKPK